MTLPELAIRRHVTTLMILVSMAMLGIVALTQLPLAFLPEMERPELYVRFQYPKASPEQIERMIVRPAEDMLGSLSGLKRMYSRCFSDSGLVNLEFDWGTNPHVARIEVWEKIDRIRDDLPDDLERIQVTTEWNTDDVEEPVLEIRLSSERDLSEDYDLIEHRILRPLQRVAGVAQVRLSGVNPKEVHINLRLADLELHRMDVRDVARILRNSNLDQSLGRVRDDAHTFTVRTVGTFETVEAIQDLPLRSDGLRLRDVADVVYEEPELEFGRHLDGQFAVGISISAEPSANAVAVCDALHERISAMRSDPHLKGLRFLVWEDFGREIKRTLAELFFSGVVGAILASLVLYAFLRRLSTTLVSVVCIPLSLVVACGFIWARGGSINTLSLLGLIVGVGLLVDNAVVVIENIFRHQELGENRKTAARTGSREVSTAVITATLTSVIVFLPLILNKPSKLSIPLKEIGSAVCLTLLASLFISQTLIPLAMSWFIRARSRPKEGWLSWLEVKYESALSVNLRRRWITPIVGLAIAGSAVYPFLQINVSFDEKTDSLYVPIHYNVSEPTPLEHKERIISYMETLIAPHRERLHIRSIYSYYRSSWCMTRVFPDEGFNSRENLDELRAELQKIVPELPGVKVVYPDGGKWSWHHNRGKRIGCQIFGENVETLEELAEEARQRIDTIEGLSDAHTSVRQGQFEMNVDLNRDLLARYDVSPEQMARTVGLTFRGQRLQRFRTPSGEREMRLTLDEQDTESLDQLHNLPTWTGTGSRLPLASVAAFREERAPRRIEREDRLKQVWVRARFTEGGREDYLPALREVIDSMIFPPGYTWDLGSWQEQKRAMSNEFLVNLGLALLLVFAVMAGLFESVQQAIALMIALPFAVSGAYWSLYAFGGDFDQAAAVGLLLLIGIVVNNGIVMIEHINSYRRGGMSRHEALILGGRERLRPILMTALTTVLGLVPIVVQQPSLGGMAFATTAVVIMGGLVVSTFLTSIFLPTTVTLVEDGFAWVGRTVRRGVGSQEEMTKESRNPGDGEAEKRI